MSRVPNSEIRRQIDPNLAVITKQTFLELITAREKSQRIKNKLKNRKM